MILNQLLFLVGLAIAVAGHVMFLVAAQRVGRGWFLACLFVPPVGLLFSILHFPRAWKPLLIELAGALVLAAAVRMTGVT